MTSSYLSESDSQAILSKLLVLREYFQNGSIPSLHQHVVNPGLALESRENYLYHLLTCALNYQRSSPATWQSALKTWSDPATRFVYFPELVIKTGENELRSALLKHKLALQPNKHIQIWSKLAQTFVEEYDSDPRKLMAAGNYDAGKILKIVQVQKKKQFPYLSGVKLSNYSLFILLHYSDLNSKLKNTKAISIIADTHIMKATVELGILPAEQVNPVTVTTAWQVLLAETEYSPIDFHSILWNWSRNSFLPAV